MSRVRRGALAGARWGIAVGAAVGLAATVVQAAETTWSGQIRIRAEGFDRSFTGSKTQWVFLQRARIGLEIQAAPEVRVFVQAQDSRAWGDELGTVTSLDNLDLHQVYADYSRAIGSTNFRARAGRQEIAYGDERIFGALGWDNVGRAFDGIQVRFTRARWTADVGAARLAQDPQTGTDLNDDVLWSYNRLASATGDRGFEPYVMYRATPNAFASSGNPVAAYETTLGERLFFTGERVRVEEEFALQVGSRDGADLKAYLFTGQASVRVAPRWSLGGGCDILSGETADPKVTLFDVRRIFHTGHKFYGIMDVAESLAGAAGLLDPYAVLELPGPRSGTTRLAAHYFRVMEASVSQTGPGGTSNASNLGIELDAEVTIPVTNGAKVELGGAIFEPQDRLQDVGLDRTSYWGYAQGIVGF